MATIPLATSAPSRQADPTSGPATRTRTGRVGRTNPARTKTSPARTSSTPDGSVALPDRMACRGQATWPHLQCDRQLRERDRQPLVRRLLDRQLVVAATQVLH